MISKKISEDEIASMKIASLPTRPNASYNFGGRGYSAAEVKAAFDKLPIYLTEKFNQLIADIKGENGGSVSDAIPTGIGDGHTLNNLFEDVSNGRLAVYLKVDGRGLAETVLEINGRLAAIEERLNSMN